MSGLRNPPLLSGSRSDLETVTESLAGSLPGNSRVDILLSNPYAFFPMIHNTDGSFTFGFVSYHGTDAADADSPRMGWDVSGSETLSYDVDYRAVSA